MLSRVADSLYWMARYLERAEHIARQVEVQFNLMLDQQIESADRRWGRVFASMGAPLPEDREIQTSAIPRLLILGDGKRSSVMSCLVHARENARQVREQISGPMWEQLNRLYHQVRGAPIDDSVSEIDLTEFLDEVRTGAFLFQGLTDSTIAHDEGWQFIQIGRHLERALSVARLLDVHFSAYQEGFESSTDAAEHLEWLGLLRSCSAFEAYLKHSSSGLTPDGIAEFLMLNAEFPYAVRFSVDRIQASLNALPEASASRKGARVARLAGRLRASLSFTQIDEIMSQGIHSYLESIQRQCGQIHASAYQGYIDYPIESARMS